VALQVTLGGRNQVYKIIRMISSWVAAGELSEDRSPAAVTGGNGENRPILNYVLG
jgi:hypothetical protein